MKQNITKEQWDEVSDEQAILLTKYLTSETLRVGEMIEFLEEDYAVRMEQWTDKWRAWRVGLNWGEDSYEYICEQPELVDALWMACKYKFTPTQ